WLMCSGEDDHRGRPGCGRPGRWLLAAALGGGSEQAQQGLRRVGEGGVAAGERQFEPDGLAAGRPAGAPGGAEQADELQAPAALVGVPGAAATGLDQAGVPDLADQGPVEEQAEPDLSLAVPQRVGDQFTDQELRGVD